MQTQRWGTSVKCFRDDLNKLSTNANSNEVERSSRGTYSLSNTILDKSKESEEKPSQEKEQSKEEDSELEESKSLSTSKLPLPSIFF